MDPNATLAMLRDLAERGSDDVEPDDMEERLLRVLELFGALDGWLSTGGFRPEAWTAPHTYVTILRRELPTVREDGLDGVDVVGVHSDRAACVRQVKELQYAGRGALLRVLVQP